MENILIILTFISFLTFWIVVVIFYTPACFNMKAMLDSINEFGELTETKAPFEWYLTNFHTIECWTISIPRAEKYLKYSRVKKTVKRIVFSRKIMAYVVPVMIICGTILLMSVE